MWFNSAQVMCRPDVPNKILARGIYEGNQTHRFRASVVGDLPFGRGQAILPSANGLVNRLVVGAARQRIPIGRSVP
jgi:hypothetical protein